MNNILDYSHMIKTYIMVTDFEQTIDNFQTCKCDKYIECFQINELNDCKNNKIILDNLPLFKILVNPQHKQKFKLPKKFKNSQTNIVVFIRVIVYIIKFKDESIDFLLNKKHIKCITLLSIYILIINNYNIMKDVMYLFKPLVINIKEKLKNNYLDNPENVNKLQILFKKYFKNSPEECINIMKSWDNLLEQLIVPVN